MIISCSILCNSFNVISFNVIVILCSKGLIKVMYQRMQFSKRTTLSFSNFITFYRSHVYTVDCVAIA